MGKIYETKDRHIFESIAEFTLERNQLTYAIDASDVNNIIVHPIGELTTVSNSVFDFIYKYCPNYSGSRDAMNLDELDCLIDNECDEEKKIHLTDKWGSDPYEWHYHRNRILNNLFKESIKNFSNGK